MQQKEIRKYTDAYKKMVLDELENTSSTYSQICERFHIRGSMTLKKWILASGRTNLLHPVKVIGVENEILQ
ncbi:MAG: transposase [Melioribacteraceae bacterium]